MDWISTGIYLCLLALGWMVIYASNYSLEGAPEVITLSNMVGKHSLFAGLSLLLFGITQIIEPRFWSGAAYPLYALSLIGLILVLIIGTTIKGATSWFSLGPFSIQPSEFAKFTTCVAMASYLSFYKTKLDQSRRQWIALGIMVTPCALILLQPDAGTVVVFLSFLIVLFRGGMPVLPYAIGASLASLFIGSLAWGYPVVILCSSWIIGLLLISSARLRRIDALGLGALWIIGCMALFIAGYELSAMTLSVVICLLVIVWRILQSKRLSYIVYAPILGLATGIAYATYYAFTALLQPHQQDRINVWLNPEMSDPRGALYNLIQSQMAISSGGLTGKGYLQGTLNKLNYVPEQSTDFIYTVVGEEMGFIGSFILIGLFTLLIWRMIQAAEASDHLFFRYYSYGLAGILWVHVMINIGMTMGLLPVIGIPLPFISYGGSSLLGFTLLIGVYIRMKRQRA